MKEITKCPISNKQDGVTYFTLGKIPIVNNLCSSRDQSLNVQTYDISIQLFGESGLHCLTKYIESDILFKNYTFKSSISTQFKDHCYQGALQMYEMIDNDSPLIVDIGGNDGTLIEQFQKVFNGRFVNIQPSNIYQESVDKNINTIHSYFDDNVAESLQGSVDLVITTNVFQHLFDINKFVQNVKLILNNNGLWMLQFPYWYNGLKTYQFDQIYHQHIYYYTVQAIYNLLNKHGMYIHDIVRTEIHGGSLRVIIGKNYIQLEKVRDYIKEQKDGSAVYVDTFHSNIKNHVTKCKQFIHNLINEGRIVYGYGASAKGCIFLNYSKIDFNLIKYVIDDTNIKQFKFIPGTGIQIKNFEHLKNNCPDYVLILSHNVAKQIVSKVKSVNSNIKCITLFPQINIV